MVRLIMIMIIETVVTIAHDVGGDNHCDTIFIKSLFANRVDFNDDEDLDHHYHDNHLTDE